MHRYGGRVALVMMLWSIPSRDAPPYRVGRSRTDTLTHTHTHTGAWRHWFSSSHARRLATLNTHPWSLRSAAPHGCPLHCSWLTEIHLITFFFISTHSYLAPLISSSYWQWSCLFSLYNWWNNRSFSMQLIKMFLLFTATCSDHHKLTYHFLYNSGKCSVHFSLHLVYFHHFLKW